MQEFTNISTKHAVITAANSGGANVPLTVHRETLLRDLPFGHGHAYVLVLGDQDEVVGVVPAREIDRRLKSTNRFERTRWLEMPIGAMLSMSISSSGANGPVFEHGELKCSAICEKGRLFGISVDGDLYLSWKRLETMFTAALSDPLTGLMNRLAYERRLREEWSRSQRTHNSIGVVVIDLDDFKLINDTYGHVVGDEVLSRVGRQLELSMRSYDVVGRFGGDEFVTLCLGCAPGEIEIPVKRLLASLAEIEFNVAGDTVRVKASVGAAVRHVDFHQTQPEDLFVAADKCLYEAKKSTSNSWKIEFTDDTEPQPQPVGQHHNLDTKLIALTVES